jgi:hypothetical protein
MKKRISVVCGLALALAFAFAGVANASTLGSTTKPSGSNETGCSTDTVINQVTSDPSTPYSVPGPGTITQWQTNVALSTPGDAVTLLVLKPVGFSYSIVGADARAIPLAATPGSIATFPLSTPIAVAGGETFGLYTDQGPGVTCYFNLGATPAGDTLASLAETATPAPGQTLDRQTTDSPGGYAMNLAATFVPTSTPAPTPTPTPTLKKKCKRHKKHKRSASSAKKKCKKKKKR